MAIKAAAKPRARYTLRYLSCRNISSPEDEDAGRKVLSGHAPASSLLELDDNHNVREYLVDAPGKVKRSPTLVHQAIRKTLADNVEEFSILNGGMVLVAMAATADDKNKMIELVDPSIINGSQTQGELKRYFRLHNNKPPADPSVKFELIVTQDDDLVAEISIARNFQNDVRAISIAGRRGQLDDLEKALRTQFPKARLRKSESDVDTEQYEDTEKLIQVIFAMMPDKIFSPLEVSDTKVFTYSQKARCLKTFQRLFEAVEEGEEEPGRADRLAAYQYCLDIAGTAWKLYEEMKSHQGFYGSRLRAIERDGGTIVDVPDGIVFPILASLSAFVRKVKGKWVYSPPAVFEPQELIDTAVSSYKEIALSNPWVMGKSKACYSSLMRVTNLYAKLGK